MLNLGQYIFLTALVLAGLQVVQLFTRDKFIKIPVNELAVASGLSVILSYLFLTYKFIFSDFSYSLVFQHSNTMKPILYKLTGIWANHEGSMMLFVTILSLYNLSYIALSKFSKRDEVLGFQGLISFLIMLYMFFTSDPFAPLPLEVGQMLPEQGMGMNPLLQDIGLALHPPLLYIGFAGFSIAFSTAMTVLRNKITSKDFADFYRPWILFAWSFLSIGVGMGAWWAYRELGWGGFWFWDPVENVSLLPWLLGTALIHLTYTTKKFNRFSFAAIFFALTTFLTALLGFFLVRSGIISSVHSFASDPTRGMAMLGIIFLLSSYAMMLFGKRLNEMKFIPEGQVSYVSREAAIMVAVLLLLAMTLTIMLGIFYPLILDIFFERNISVGEPYFNLTFVPIALTFIFLAVFVPALKWQQERLWTVLRKNAASFIVTLLLTTLLSVRFTEEMTFKICAAIFLCLWLFISCIEAITLRLIKKEKVSRGFTSMIIAHSSFGLLGLAIALNAALSQDMQKGLAVGDKAEFAGYDLEMKGTNIGRGTNFIAQQVEIDVSKNGDMVKFFPENRVYFPSLTKTHESDIQYSILRDIYIVTGESEKNNGTEIFPVRLYIKPFMSFIWLAVLSMAFGGFLAMLPKKK